MSTFAGSLASLICVNIDRVDESTNTGLVSFSKCGPLGHLTVANGLTSASFGGTVTGTESFSGQQMSVTVNAQLSGVAGRVETSELDTHENTPFTNTQVHGSDKFRPASGSINVDGDISLSTDGATGLIGDFKQGWIIIDKHLPE